jgi:hypothetical protein
MIELVIAREGLVWADPAPLIRGTSDNEERTGVVSDPGR